MNENTKHGSAIAPSWPRLVASQSPAKPRCLPKTKGKEKKRKTPQKTNRKIPNP